MSDEQNPLTGYLEDCCWTWMQDQCKGSGCACRCHGEIVARSLDAIKAAPDNVTFRDLLALIAENERLVDAVELAIQALTNLYELGGVMGTFARETGYIIDYLIAARDGTDYPPKRTLSD
jgi:hypothetical protein